MGDLANLTRWEPFADGSADTLNSDILVSISSLVVTIAVLYLTPDGASCTVRWLSRVVKQGRRKQVLEEAGERGPCRDWHGRFDGSSPVL